MDGSTARKNAPHPLEAIVNSHRLLEVLRIMQSLYGCGNEELVRALLAKLGFKVGFDRLREDFGLLEKEGLVTVHSVEELRVAAITHKGLEVVEGSLEIDGIRVPSLGGTYRV